VIPEDRPSRSDADSPRPGIGLSRARSRLSQLALAFRSRSASLPRVLESVRRRARRRSASSHASRLPRPAGTAGTGRSTPPAPSRRLSRSRPGVAARDRVAGRYTRAPLRAANACWSSHTETRCGHSSCISRKCPSARSNNSKSRPGNRLLWSLRPTAIFCVETIETLLSRLRQSKRQDRQSRRIASIPQPPPPAFAALGPVIVAFQ